MADIPARTELKVTTGPIRGSRKVHLGPLNVAMRQVMLEPSSGEPPVTLYDTSGPYTDPNARIDIMAGLPELRSAWIRGRGDVEEVQQREVRPEDNGQLGPDRSGGVQPFPNVRKKVLRARPGANVTQMHYARHGIITPETVIDTYNEEMTQLRAEQLRESVTASLRRAFIEGQYTDCFIYAGAVYHSALAPLDAWLPPDVRARVSHGGIGEQLSQLKRWLGGHRTQEQKK